MTNFISGSNYLDIHFTNGVTAEINFRNGCNVVLVYDHLIISHLINPQDSVIKNVTPEQLTEILTWAAQYEP